MSENQNFDPNQQDLNQQPVQPQYDPNQYAAPQQPYQQPYQPYAPVAPTTSGGIGIVALIMGIASIFLGFVLGWLIIFAPIGVALGIVGLVLAVKSKKTGNTLATGALVCSIIGLIFSAIMTFSCTVPAICLASSASAIESELNDLSSDLDDWANSLEDYNFDY
ncbi:MAG: DUF308 domain-containing protein [Oscillospiraceae bacterium]|jgi:hypothetical protein|nr:DUF308 domain-containing protein [Oscillospiraceae bacterium]